MTDKGPIQPIRLRLSRRKGFDLQINSVAVNGLPGINVGRPSKWGNPFIVGKDGTRDECVELHILLLGGLIPFSRSVLSDSISIEQLKHHESFVRANISDLRNHNLACWCALDGKPCHADILLQFANKAVCDEVKP